MIYIVVILLIALIIYVIAFFNTVTKWNQNIKEAFATLDVYLKKRWDLIPNLVNCLKEESNFEKRTLEEIVQLRTKNYEEMSNKDKINLNENIQEQLNRILILTENYPDLKSIASYQTLMKELIQVEDEIANSRKYYNAVIRIYNNKVQMFPNIILAKLFQIKPKKMFDITSEEREVVEVTYEK